MKKRLCVAAAGAVLSAGLVGGAGFGVTGSRSDTVTCARLAGRVSLLQGLKDAATAQGQTARAARIDREITRLQTRETNLGC